MKMVIILMNMIMKITKNQTNAIFFSQMYPLLLKKDQIKWAGCKLPPPPPLPPPNGQWLLKTFFQGTPSYIIEILFITICHFGLLLDAILVLIVTMIKILLVKVSPSVQTLAFPRLDASCCSRSPLHLHPVPTSTTYPPRYHLCHGTLPTCH